MTSDGRKPWWRIQWFADEDTREERKLIVKLDLLIVPYAFLAYWTKYIDQANLNNAYVSGMKDDLGFAGNELVQLQTMYTVGAVVGQIPFMFLFTVFPMNWVIPFLDVCWGIFTLLQFRANSFAEIAAYRFLVGWFEAAFFPAMHYIFGAWYRGDEIARRGGVFYVGLTLGTLTAGLIQAGASSSLHDVNSLAGWRWMYIIDVPLSQSLLEFWDTSSYPERRISPTGYSSNRRISTWQYKDSRELGTQPRANLNGAINTSTGGFLLWIKSLDRYSTPKVNELGTISPALGIFYTLLICFASDLFLGPAWAITAAHVWNIIGLIVLVVWKVPEPALWFAFATTYSAVAMSSVLYGWVNHQLRGSSAQRAFTLVLINAVSRSTTAWTPLLVFPTVEAPRFTKGYSFVLANAICLIALAHFIRIFLKRQESSADTADAEASDAEGAVAIPSKDVAKADVV
ncbi:hypothetical protein FJTKL_04960 [Diaporthe vaccinii]|uniref:Major facilitator superfamily transporter n=1 Tax=Diaporthe vaccinii TaxID=105482 RepID=A0ABR4EYJ8_9PEZI